ncbi:hypothetical protein CLF_106040 [Clonorchis sinensis]|uniref:Uncharacterized protein n=1 Tax=Clonorchis sinensis TaxID=79923 RepID=G7YPL7_CLOSI|nr:hypothetical protein CLF_106040 [Clonorchis sinensis]
MRKTYCQIISIKTGDSAEFQAIAAKDRNRVATHPYHRIQSKWTERIDHTPNHSASFRIGPDGAPPGSSPPWRNTCFELYFCGIFDPVEKGFGVDGCALETVADSIARKYRDVSELLIRRIGGELCIEDKSMDARGLFEEVGQPAYGARDQANAV